MGQYYHPLGENAEKLLSGATYGQKPHSRDTHGWSKLDIGAGAGLPVYSMSSGTISSVCSKTDTGNTKQSGYVVVIRTDNVDGAGKPIYINYLEMRGLTEKFASLLGVDAGDDTYNHKEQRVAVLNRNIRVDYGEQIGYTGTYVNSNLHIDFTYGDRYNKGQKAGEVHEGFDSADHVPHLTSTSQLSSEFSYDGSRVYCNDELVGREDGKVPGSSGEATIYTVYPVISYLTLLQVPKKGSSTVSTPTIVDGLVYDEKVDVTKKIKLSQDDWNAIYGLYWSEEGNLFKREKNYEVAAGIIEWIARCIRNRLISGSSLQTVCTWADGVNPGYARVRSLGETATQEIKDFIKPIIEGRSYGYVEKLAKKYPYKDFEVGSDSWAAHLYAAATFYGGGTTARVANGVAWKTLAIIPFSDGYFHFEAEFTTKTGQLFNSGFFNDNPVLKN